MAKGRELKGRIKSVENTRKITRTMEMVATSKMKRAADRVASARPYALALGELLSQVYTPELADRFPLLRRPTQVKRVALVVLTANRGLCGGFNTNLLREARARLAELESELAQRIETIARVRVVPGSPRWFGAGAAGHIRLSLATTRAVLDEALTRIERAWPAILAAPTTAATND